MECWVWKGRRDREGYGVTYVRGQATGAHRVAVERARGEKLLAGEVVRHLCRCRACVNPAHLEPVTHRENLARGNTHVATHERRRRTAR